MIESRTQEIAKVKNDYSWAMSELWFTDGTGLAVSFKDMDRVFVDGPAGVSIVGARVKLELVNGRWTLARLLGGGK